MIGIVDQQLVTGEIGKALWRAVAREVIGCRTKQPMVGREFPRDKAGVTQIGNAQSDIEAIAHDIHE